MPAQPADPIEEARAINRQIVADTMMLRGANELSADAMRSETDRLRLELEKKRLEAEVEKAGNHNGGPDPMGAYLLEEVKALRQSLQEMQSAATESKIQALLERMEMLKEEALRSSASATGAPSSLQSLTSALQELKEAQEVLAALSPQPAKPQDQGMVEGVAFEAWKLNRQLEHDLRMLDRQEAKELKLQELAQKRESALEELSLKREHYTRVDRFLEQTMPKIVEIGNKILDRLGIAMAEGVDAAAGTPSAMPDSRAAISPGPGVESMECQTCGQTLLFRQGWAGVICPRCGSEYTNTTEQEVVGPRHGRSLADMPSANVEEEQEAYP